MSADAHGRTVGRLQGLNEAMKIVADEQEKHSGPVNLLLRDIICKLAACSREDALS